MTWRPLLLMINEAVMCLEEGFLSTPTDGDLGAVFGLGFLPFTGGPFRFADAYGINELVQLMEDHAKKFGPKFNPRPLLASMAENNQLFHSKNFD